MFVDGVRVNEPLADQVNWDLIPSDAIARIELIPGSNPVYGRNTLGGAIVMHTKRGLTHPGTTAEAWGGSFGRIRSLLQTGGTVGPLDYFLSGNWFTEDGFRDFSQSDVWQLFGKVGYVSGPHDLALSWTYIKNRLTGKGPLPVSRLQRDRSAVYTHPDHFKPDLWLLNGEYRREFALGLMLSTNLYGRLLAVDQFNRDVEEDVTARTQQDSWGGTAQLTYQGTLFDLPLTATLGIDYTGASLDHVIGERERIGDGDQEENVEVLHGQDREGNDRFTVETDVTVKTHSGGVFLTATLEPVERFTITVAGRFDTTALSLTDRQPDAHGNDASGSHHFEGFNPSIGATYSLT